MQLHNIVRERYGAIIDIAQVDETRRKGEAVKNIRKWKLIAKHNLTTYKPTKRFKLRSW